MEAFAKHPNKVCPKISLTDVKIPSVLDPRTTHSFSFAKAVAKWPDWETLANDMVQK